MSVCVIHNSAAGFVSTDCKLVHGPQFDNLTRLGVRKGMGMRVEGNNAYGVVCSENAAGSLWRPSPPYLLGLLSGPRLGWDSVKEIIHKTKNGLHQQKRGVNLKAFFVVFLGPKHFFFWWVHLFSLAPIREVPTKIFEQIPAKTF